MSSFITSNLPPRRLLRPFLWPLFALLVSLGASPAAQAQIVAQPESAISTSSINLNTKGSPYDYNTQPTGAGAGNFANRNFGTFNLATDQFTLNGAMVSVTENGGETFDQGELLFRVFPGTLATGTAPAFEVVSLGTGTLVGNVRTFTLSAANQDLLAWAASASAAPGTSYRFDVRFRVTDNNVTGALLQSPPIRSVFTAVSPAANQPPVIPNQTRSVDENLATGTDVGAVVAASDPDANTTLSYAITAGNADGRFAIDSGTGQLTVAGALDFEATSSYALTVQVSDGSLSDDATVTVSVTNVNERPVIAAQSRTIAENSANGTAVGAPLAASDVDAGTSLSYAITAGNGTGSGAFAISNAGQLSVADVAQLGFEATPTFTLTVQVSDGSLTASSPITVTGCVPPVPPLRVTPASTVYTGGVATTLYLGYGPQQVTLTASGGGTTYRWSGPTGLNSLTSAAPVFTATTAGTFTYSLVVTSTSGCSALPVSVTLTVVEARCSSSGKKLDKVLVCHNGTTLCISPADVADHLKHGDPLGACSRSNARSQAVPVAGGESARLEAYPNPFTAATTLRFRAAQSGRVQLQVYNSLGQRVAILYDEVATAGQLVERTFQARDLSNGLYTVRLTGGGLPLSQRLVLSK